MNPKGLSRIPRIVCVVGPTASGKTQIGLALAKEFHGEVVNADARQVYRGFDIGTGKPVGGRRVRIHGEVAYIVKGIPHYLMDILAPVKIYTVAEWRKRALSCIEKIRRRGRLPIVVGGTGLYTQSLIDHYRIPPIAPNPAFRAAMEDKTIPELMRMLEMMDPESAKLIDSHNRRRVVRALEVITFSGKPFSAQRIQAPPLVDPLLIGWARTREDLHQMIDRSVDNMMREGWMQEVAGLAASGIPWDAPAMTSIGYKELGTVLRGEERDLEKVVAEIKRATRHYAKRQMTWFKRDPRIRWVSSIYEAKERVRAWLAEPQVASVDAQTPLDKKTAAR